MLISLKLEDLLIDESAMSHPSVALPISAHLSQAYECKEFYIELSFSLFLSLSADVFDLEGSWIRYLYLSPPKRLALTCIIHLVLALCIFLQGQW